MITFKQFMEENRCILKPHENEPDTYYVFHPKSKEPIGKLIHDKPNEITTGKIGKYPVNSNSSPNDFIKSGRGSKYIAAVINNGRIKDSSTLPKEKGKKVSRITPHARKDKSSVKLMSDK